MELTLKDIQKAQEIIKENQTCTCNPGHYFYCEKCGVIGISYEDATLVRELLK